MDEAYDSPDSDGHASIPSPTETSFNMSTLHDARPWPPASPSPSPGTTSDDEEEDDQPVVVVRRNFKSGAVPMLPSILDSSPPASRILKPTSVNDSVSSTPKHPRKRSFENLPKKSAEMTSDGESTAGETTEIAGAPGPSNATTDEADSYALPSPGPSPLLSPHPSSTPDPRTGLTKRINLRKNWSSPIKETQECSVSLSGEPVLPLRYDGGDEDESIEVPMIKRPSSAPYLSTEQHAEDSAGRPRPMLPEYTPERPLSAGSRPQTQRLPRAMSELSIASLTRHESFEEIDAAFVREKLSQAFESARPQRSSEQNRKASHPDKSFEKEPEAVSKISGDPQTPQNNGASRRKYLPTNILNFSLKRDIASTSQITPDRAALFATGSGTRGILETPAGMTSSPPGSPGPRYTEEADLPEGEGDSEYAVSRTMEESHDSLSPQHPYHGFSPWKFNNSKPVRRVSIGSPPAASPMSATDSPFFRRGPTSPDLQTSKHNRRGKLGSVVIFEDNQPQEGMIPPVNTPTTRNARRPHVDHDKARMRERSRSDPLDLRGDDGIISVPSTVNSVRKVDKSAPDLAQGITEDSHIQDTQEGSSTVEGSPPCDSPDGQRVLEVRSSRSSSSVGNPEEEPTSKDAVNNRGAGNNGRLWSGFSETFQSDGNRRFEPGEEVIQEKEADESSQHPMVSSPGGSLALGDVEVRVQTPLSVGDNSEFIQDPEYFRRGNTELQQILNRALNQNQELRARTREQNEILAQYEEEYGEVQGEVEAHRQRVRYLERQVMDLQNEAMRKKQGSETSSPPGSVRPHTRTIAELRAKVDSLEIAAEEQAEAHRRENEEHENTIGHLRAALNQRVDSTINEPLQKRIMELERQLQEERKAHSQAIAKTEDKYKHLLKEQDGMINHLQGELDEYANHLPVDSGDRTSRVFDDNGDWIDEQEITQMFEDSFDQIITQIGGDPEREDFDEEAIMEAEKSLRYLAATAGYDNLSKADLAAFGIKHLRDDNAHYKEMCAQSEEKVKQLRLENDSLTREMELLKTQVKDMEMQNGVLQNSISDSKTTIERLQTEMRALQTRIAEADRALEDALHDNEKSSATIKSSEAELLTLRQTYSKDQQELEKSMTKLAQAEQKAKEQEQHLTEMRAQLQATVGRDLTLQTEVDAYKQRTSELLRTVETVDKTHKDRVMALQEQIDDLRSAKENLIKERDAAREAEKRTIELSAVVVKLEEKIRASDETLGKFKAQKEALEIATYAAETEAKQARSRFNVLLHESAAKETIWDTVKKELQSEVEQKTRELHHAVEPYEKALSIIATQVDEIAPEGEGDDERRQIIRTELEKDGVAAVDTVSDVLVGIRTLDMLIDGVEAQRKDLDDKNQRLKNAIKKWNSEHSREKSKVEALKKENKELALRLKAEKKQSDEKIGQLILALRR